ncbi:hypothetical protein VSR68_37605 [Paraburkholderia phymatum]|uniref:hypothetical protein n=1 Tax=Paraburkholderia phymatum TaxID=148447 RepID=UPI0031787044
MDLSQHRLADMLGTTEQTVALWERRGKIHAIANGTLTLTASTTNYVYADPTTGAVSVNTTGYPSGKVPLYSIVTGTTTVSSYTDCRSYQPSATGGSGGSFGNQNANYVFAGPSSGAAAAPLFRQLVGADFPVFGASGASHSAGAVPDPGATAGNTRFLREDGTWQVPSGAGGSSTLSGLTDVSVTEGAGINGYSLTWNNTTGKWVATNVSGGSSSSSGFGTPDTPPASSAFTWVNQGSSTVANDSYGMYIVEPGHTGDSVALLVKAKPSTTSWRMAARLKFLGSCTTYNTAGLCLYDSVSGKICHFGLQITSTSAIGLLVQYFNSTTSYNTNAIAAVTWAEVPDWWSIRTDGTNYYFEVSQDGINWMTFGQVAVGAFITANQVGVFINASNSTSIPYGLRVFSFTAA